MRLGIRFDSGNIIGEHPLESYQVNTHSQMNA